MSKCGSSIDWARKLNGEGRVHKKKYTNEILMSRREVRKTESFDSKVRSGKNCPIVV